MDGEAGHLIKLNNKVMVGTPVARHSYRDIIYGAEHFKISNIVPVSFSILCLRILVLIGNVFFYGAPI